MGWKNVKTHYRIGHLVHQREDGAIAIGSPYISDIIVVAADGRSLLKEYDRGGNDDLARYQAEMQADLETLHRLVTTPDTFEKSVPVYTYDGATIEETACEEPGWPNCTHDGRLMYENMFSTDRAKVIGWAKTNAECGVRGMERLVADLEEKLIAYRAELARHRANLEQLKRDHP